MYSARNFSWKRCPKKDHILLKIDHLGEEAIKRKLPEIREISMTFANVDPIYEAIPVVPTCHYRIGGIPTNIHGQVLTQDQNGADKIIDGLYSVEGLQMFQSMEQIALVEIHT